MGTGTRLHLGLESTNAVCGLSSGTWPAYLTPLRGKGEAELLLGFFGGGMPVRAWQVAPDAAIAPRFAGVRESQHALLTPRPAARVKRVVGRVSQFKPYNSIEDLHPLGNSLGVSLAQV